MRLALTALVALCAAATGGVYLAPGMDAQDGVFFCLIEACLIASMGLIFQTGKGADVDVNAEKRLFRVASVVVETQVDDLGIAMTPWQRHRSILAVMAGLRLNEQLPGGERGEVPYPPPKGGE